MENEKQQNIKVANDYTTIWVRKQQAKGWRRYSTFIPSVLKSELQTFRNGLLARYKMAGGK